MEKVTVTNEMTCSANWYSSIAACFEEMVML